MAETNLERLNREKLEISKALELEKKEFTYDKLAEYSGHKKELLTILHRTVAKDTTPAEFAYFLTVCNDTGLSPVNKEIWCYKDNKGNLLVFSGRDGFLKKCKQNPKYRGIKSSEVCEKDEFELDMINGSIIHKIKTERGKVLGAYAIVYMEGMKDTIVYLAMEEFDQAQAKWKTAPKMMIKKCAQSHALKEASDISGVVPEEAVVVQNGAVHFANDISHEEVSAPVDKSEERLLKMIEASANREQLNKLSSECNTTETNMAYDAKWKILE